MSVRPSTCGICWPSACNCPRSFRVAMDRFAVRGFWLQAVAMRHDSGRLVVIDEHGAHKYVPIVPRWKRWRSGRTERGAA